MKLSRSRIRQVLGVDYPTSQVRRTLTSLGFEETKEPGGLIDLIETLEAGPSSERTDTLWLKVPYWRSDISIEDDLVEELARIIGYDSIPTTMLSGSIPHWQPQPMTQLKDTHARPAGRRRNAGDHLLLSHDAPEPRLRGRARRVQPAASHSQPTQPRVGVYANQPQGQCSEHALIQPSDSPG